MKNLFEKDILNKCFSVRIIATLAVVLALSSQATMAATSSSNKRIVGYFVEWGVYARNYHVADIPVEKLTHINYAFAKIENGRVAVWDTYAALEKFYPATDSWTDPSGTLRGNFNQLRVLKETYPHIKVFISVGGWTGSGEFSNMANTAEGRRRFAQSALQFIETYNFDGVDIDWEYPVCNGLQAGRPEDKENFTLLLKELRQTLGNDALLTIAASANPDCLNSIEIDEFIQYLDWVNIMTYDFHGDWEANYGTTGHNSPLYNNNDPLSPSFNIDSAVNYLLNRGVPLQKIVTGLAFYGRSASGVRGKDGLYAPFSGPGPGSYEEGFLEYKDIEKDYLDKNGYTYSWDDLAKVPYLFNKDKKEFISFDDRRSIENKASYVAGNGLSGVMFWELSGDNGELINAIHKGLGNPEIPEPQYACSDGIDNDSDGLTDYPSDPGCESAKDNDETNKPPSQPGDTITVDVSVGDDWGTGYCANAVVTNLNPFQIDWVVEFDIDGTISSLWNGSYSQVDEKVTARGNSWNRTLEKNASTTFGFCAERDDVVSHSCSDGRDNDRDGLIDYPNDPGCESVQDDDESNQDSPGEGIETEIIITTDWITGYCADVAITNMGNRPADWSSQFEIEGIISSLWNARHSQNGYSVAVEGLDWNNVLLAGQTTNIGFCATR